MYYVIQVKTGKEQKAIEDILKNKPDDASFDVFSPYRKSLRKYKGENKEVVQAICPNCYKMVPADPSMQAAICPICKKPFIVADAVIMSEQELFTRKRIKCPFCGKEQERNKYGCIYCHKEIPV